MPDSARNRSQQEKDSVRDQIAEAALRLFADKGFAATSMREIVEAVGVTKPTLYYYFESKENLYTTLIAEEMTRFYDDVASRTRIDGGLKERLRAVAEGYFHALADRPHLARLFMRATLTRGAHTPHFDFEEHAQRIHDIVRDILADAAASGEIAPEMARPFLGVEFLGLVLVFVLRSALGYRDNLTGPKAALVAELFMRGLEGLAQEDAHRIAGILPEEDYSSV